MTHKYFLKSFGCQMNSADSEFITNLLIARGFSAAQNVADADVVIVNTCTVREKAENKAVAQIREYAALKKKGSLLWVIGCAAESGREILPKKIPKITKLIGATEIEFIEEKIDEYLLPLGSFEAGLQNIKSEWSSLLPITRGCDNFCTYCIVPYVRGREHSVKSLEILAQAKKMVESGASEITLLGQNVNSYFDNDENLDFADLLTKVAQTPNLKRLRFMTSHPKDISRKLVEVIAETSNICKHIHLPVQAGNSEVLEKMNRKYTREQYLEKIAMIREIIPACDITTDVMVGFPNETQEQFEETLSLFEEVRFLNAFMFAYSAREGTEAAKSPNQIPVKEKSARLAKLVELQNNIVKDIYSTMVGREFEVLFTMSQSKKGANSWVGQDFGAKRILVDSDDDLGGKIAKVKIVKSTGMTLVGELV
ncbi:MAG: tRNA (N6-isopentenyl adenosine(37)-C2)-methylthiotransferase MiaB [Chitinivibrionia bacterium]|nr:tRNA (N6-isopentenyl adenosine(37)-C2)-methylthiotransferase MiaB [Chitinivibrionia bacterium]